jgi:hypothetical protein
LRRFGIRALDAALKIEDFLRELDLEFETLVGVRGETGTHCSKP